MDIKQELVELRARIGGESGFSQIIQIAERLAEQEILQRLAKMFPGLRQVGVEIDGYDDCVDGHVLTFANGDVLRIYATDVDEFFEISVECIAAVAKAMGIAVPEEGAQEQLLEEIPEELERAAKAMFQHLEDLPRIAGIPSRDEVYVLDGAVSQ